MKNMTLLRLKQTAKLEHMIEEGCRYEDILKESKKLDKFIVHEMQQNIKKTIDKSPGKH